MYAPAAKMYRPRNPEVSPSYRLVREHFEEFERDCDELFLIFFGHDRRLQGKLCRLAYKTIRDGCNGRKIKLFLHFRKEEKQ